MKVAVLALAVAGLASAQNSSLIPSGISSSCSSFLTTLNTDATLSNCVQPLINTTSSFSPTTGANLTASDINFTLSTLCKSVAGCSDSSIRSWLSQFYGACSQELTGTTGYNAQVRELYDILYVINPLKAAVCSIDSANQDYCVHEVLSAERTAANATVGANSTASGNSTNSTASFATLAVGGAWSPVALAAEYLYIPLNGASSLARRLVNFAVRQEGAATNGTVNTNGTSSQSTFATIITPNTTTYRNTNLPFLFLQPNMASLQLCTTCTRAIMVSYIKWESTVPYALGLSASPILGGQMTLWNAINGTCGANFTNAIMNEVGVLTAVGNAFSGATQVIGGAAATTAVVGVAFVAGAMALLA